MYCFSDVEMPKMGGIELLKNLENPPLVVLMMNLPLSLMNTMLQTFKKPVEWARFIKTVKKINNKLFGTEQSWLKTTIQNMCSLKQIQNLFN